MGRSSQSVNYRGLNMKVPLTLFLVILVPSLEVHGRPSTNCNPIPSHLCAVAYDSATCRPSGWILPLAEGRIQFRFWSSWWKYRNDMDLIAVRNGCVFTGYSDSEYNGDIITVRAQGGDQWIVFRSSSQYYHMDEDIESVECYCNTPGTG